MQKIISRKIISVLLFCFVSIPAFSGLSAQNQSGLDTEFPAEFEKYLPGYKNLSAQAVQGDDEVQEEKEEAASGGDNAVVSFFSRMFSDRTVLNILLLVVAFVIFLIYRLRYHKVRR